MITTQLDAYHDLVRKYHRTLDLVSDAALDRFEALIQQGRAYADTIDRVGQPGSILDVGSGVGLPGIVVAVALPHRQVLLVERRRRRATFLRIVVAQLGLQNARVSESDVREVRLGSGSDAQAGTASYGLDDSREGADARGAARAHVNASPDAAGGANGRAPAGMTARPPARTIAGTTDAPADVPTPSPAESSTDSPVHAPAELSTHSQVRVPAIASPAAGFAVVTAQAVAALADIYCLTRHLHANDVTLVARKGPSWQAEIEAMEARIGAAAAMRGEAPLPGSGTLVAIDVPGGLPCLRSG